MYPKVILKGIFCVLPDNFLRFAWQATLFFISLNIIIIIKMFQSGSFQAVLLSFLIVSIFFTLSEKAMEGLKKLLYPHYLKTLDIVLTFIIATRII